MPSRDEDEKRPCPGKKPMKPKKALREDDGTEEIRSCMEAELHALKDKAMNKQHLVNMAVAVCKLGMTEEQVLELEELELQEIIDEYKERSGGKLFDNLDEIPDVLWEYQDYQITATGRLVAVKRTRDGRRLVEFTATVEQEDNHGSVIDIEAFELAIRNTPDYNGFMWLPVVMDSHTNRPIGKVLEYEFTLKEGRDGKPKPSLWCKAELRKGMMIADQRWEQIQELAKKDGGFKQMGASVGFDIRQDAFFCESFDKCYYRITQMDWYEVSILAPGLEPSQPGSDDVQPTSKTRSIPTVQEATELAEYNPDPAPSTEDRLASLEAKIDKLLAAQEAAATSEEEGDQPDPETEGDSTEEPAAEEENDGVVDAVKKALDERLGAFEKKVPGMVQDELRKLGITRSHPSTSPNQHRERFPPSPEDAAQQRAGEGPDFGQQVEAGIKTMEY